MVQKWPVKVAIRNYVDKPVLPSNGNRSTCYHDEPDSGRGTGFIPGPFGTEDRVATCFVRFADADIIIMAACGERANEVVEILPSSRSWKTHVPVVSCTREPRSLPTHPICPWLP
ncbi:MAG: hypothetical protein ACLTZT_02290 [Butyricimonas faecalis]